MMGETYYFDKLSDFKKQRSNKNICLECRQPLLFKIELNFSLLWHLCKKCFGDVNKKIGYDKDDEVIEYLNKKEDELKRGLD